MEKELELLVVCTHEGIRATMLRLLHNHQPVWHATGAESAAQAIELADEKPYDVVLLGNGLTEEQELQLTEHIITQNQSAKIIKHYGGGSGLLFGEIYQALSR